MNYWTLIILSFFSFNIEAVTLNEAFQHILRSHPQIMSSRIQSDIAGSRINEVESNFLPSLRATSTSEWRDPSGVLRGRGRTTLLSASQPIFMGGKEYHALKQAEQIQERSKQDEKVVAWNLYEELTQIFYDVLILEKDIENLVSQKSVVTKRIHFIKDRVGIGRSSPSELSSALSLQARTEAEIMRRKSDLVLRRRDLAFLTKLDANVALEAPSYRVEDFIKKNEPYNPLLHPSITLSKMSAEIAQTSLKMTRSDYIPTLSLSGTYFIERDGFNSASKWNVALNLNWDIFTGLSTKHQAMTNSLEMNLIENQIQDQKARLELEYEKLQRALRDRKDTYKQLKKALKLAEESYNHQQKDYELGRINNLELMRGLEDSIQIRRSVDSEQIELQRIVVRLQHLRES